MFGKHQFYGSTTVGERGQIVLPAKLREDMKIGAGDKLLVLTCGPPEKESVMIMKSDVLSEMVKIMGKHYQDLLELANNK